ncbi:MAG: DNA polymerase III subunit gamma/tau, partial [Betaproteobacteria bacterium]|nr:DNA polymerase III subunit gamma/tau [Betaproteobacteria bacterium]
NTKVDEMRELLETAQYAPVSGRYKVYIIDEVHMLSKSAFNAMLKTLEEPPAHVEFVLATTDPQKLPITVLSRCLQFNLKNLPPALIASHLQHILQVEAVPFDEASLALIGKAAEGSVRDSLSLLDQAIAYGAGEVRYEQVADILGALDQSYLFSLFDFLADRDAKALVAEVNRLALRSISFDATLKDMASLLSRMALVQSAGADAVDGQDASRVVAAAARLSADDVQLFYQIALLGRRDLSLAPDEETGFTMTLLRMLAFAQGEGASSKPSAMTSETPASSATPASRAAEITPVLAEKARVTQPVVADAAPTAFTGDWPGFVAQLGLSGMAGMLARQCEFESFEDGVLALRVLEAHKHLAERVYQEKLKQTLEAALGAPIRLSIKIGSMVGTTLAALEDREQMLRQEAAVRAIEQDTFVKHLKQDFGAEVVPSSIRPV